MNAYLISYDLRVNRDYERLYEAIKSYGTYAKILESVWGIVTDASASEIRDHLENFVDKDDGIFVLKSGKQAAWRNLNGVDNWLQNNL